MKNLFLTILIFCSIAVNAQRGVSEPVLVQSDTNPVSDKIPTKAWLRAHPTGVTPIDDIFDWTINKYTFYPSQAAGKFDNGAAIPIHYNRANWDGILYATEFYGDHYATNIIKVVNGSSNTTLYAGTMLGQTPSGVWNFGTTQLIMNPNGTARTFFDNTVNNQANAVVYKFDCDNQLTTAGAKLAAFYNQGTEKSNIDKDGIYTAINGQMRGYYGANYFEIKNFNANATYVRAYPELSQDNFIFRTYNEIAKYKPFFLIQGDASKPQITCFGHGVTYFGDWQTSSDLMIIDSVGYWENYGAGRTWQDIIVPGNQFRVGSTAPGFNAYKAGLYLYQFAVNDEVHFSFEIPHDWTPGTVLKPHIHWLLPGLETGNVSVKWELVYSVGNYNQTFSSAQTISKNDTTNIYPDKHIITQIGTIPTIYLNDVGDVVVCRLRRIAATGSAPGTAPMVVSIGIHYMQNSNGSKKELTKF